MLECCPPLDAAIGSLFGEELRRRRRGFDSTKGTSDGSWWEFGVGWLVAWFEAEVPASMKLIDADWVVGKMWKEEA